MKSQDPYTSLARQALINYLKTGKAEVSASLTDMEIFKKKGGCFVTLYKNGELRGCMGTIEPTQENLGREIMQNTVRAAIYDSRFLPVTEEELPFLAYAVDIIHQPEIIHAAEGYNVKEYGIIVMKEGRTGLLLPNLDGINTPAEQLRIALGKAGISLSEQFVMKRFQSEHYGEKVQ
jgi:AmmeMemoRadiSam system protein A